MVSSTPNTLGAYAWFISGTAGEQILELMNVLKSLKDIISPTYFNGEQMVLTLLDLGVTAKLFLLSTHNTYLAVTNVDSQIPIKEWTTPPLCHYSTKSSKCSFFVVAMPLPITEKQRFQDLLQPIFLFTAYEGYCARIAAMMECLNDMYLKYK